MVWTSPYEAVEVDGATLHGLVAEAARRSPDRPALVDGGSGSATTYGALEREVRRVASALAAGGFEPGDTLALWAPNGPQWAATALGAMAAGGRVTGIPPLASDGELAAQLGDAGAGVLVAPAPLLDRARRAAPPSVRSVQAIGDLPDGAGPGVPPPVDAGAVALVPYSSGTSGLPKGVLLTHRNLVASVRQLERLLRITERDVVLALPPFAHVMGLVVTCALPLACGARVVTMGRFELEALLALVERHGVTVLVVPPPVAGALASHPLVERFDLSSLQLVVSGGAPLDADRHRALAARLAGAAVGQGYGMTETAVGVSGPDRATGTTPGSVGRLMPGTELRVVDPATGRDLGPGADGELWVRGPQVTPGYLGRPEETAALVDADGWLRTGDLGHVDPSGDVWIVDRLKELIKVSGHQVAPAELEALLARHPRVADAAVAGRPDPERGEVPVAAVVPRGELDPDAVAAWVAERVAPHKRLHDVRTVEAIPRTPAGKILRRLVAADLAAQAVS